MFWWSSSFLILILANSTSCQIKLAEDICHLQCSNKGRIMRNFLNDSKNVFIINSHKKPLASNNCLFQKFMKAHMTVKNIFQYEDNKTVGEATNKHLKSSLILNDIHSFVFLIPHLESSMLWNNSFFQLVVTSNTNPIILHFYKEKNMSKGEAQTIIENKLTDFFTLLWVERKITRVIGIASDDECEQNVYFAYNTSNWKYGMYGKTLRFMDELDLVVDPKIMISVDLHVNYPVRTVTFQSRFSYFKSSAIIPPPLEEQSMLVLGHRGADAFIFVNMIEYFKFKPIFIEISGTALYGSIYNDKPPSGALAYIVNGSADFSVNSRLMRHYTKEYLYILPVNVESVCAMIERFKLEPAFSTIFLMIPISVYILFLTSILLVFILRQLLITSNSPVDWKDGLWIFMETALISLVPIKSLMLRIKNKERTLAFNILVMGIFITALFQALVSSILSKGHTYLDIKTLEELNSVAEKLITVELHQDIFESDPSIETPVLKSLKEKTVVVAKDFIPALIDNVTLDTAIVYKKSKLEAYSTNESYYENGKNKFHIVQECSKNYFTAFVASKNFPFSQEIKEFMFTLSSTGIVDWYMGIVKHSEELKLQKSLSHLANNRPPGSLKELQIPFYFWIFGVFTSFIVFILEILWKIPLYPYIE